MGAAGGGEGVGRGRRVVWRSGSDEVGRRGSPETHARSGRVRGKMGRAERGRPGWGLVLFSPAAANASSERGQDDGRWRVRSRAVGLIGPSPGC